MNAPGNLRPEAAWDWSLLKDILLLRHRVARFIAVGVLNTAFGYGVFAAAYALGAHYSLATFLSVVLGVLFNFKSFERLVFSDRQSGKFLRFLSVYAVIYAANTAGLFLLKQGERGSLPRKRPAHSAHGGAVVLSQQPVHRRPASMRTGKGALGYVVIGGRRLAGTGHRPP